MSDTQKKLHAHYQGTVRVSTALRWATLTFWLALVGAYLFAADSLNDWIAIFGGALLTLKTLRQYFNINGAMDAVFPPEEEVTNVAGNRRAAHLFLAATLLASYDRMPRLYVGNEQRGRAAMAGATVSGDERIYLNEGTLELLGDDGIIAVLVHELAHFVRGDCLITNPLHWPLPHFFLGATMGYVIMVPMNVILWLINLLPLGEAVAANAVGMSASFLTFFTIVAAMTGTKHWQEREADAFAARACGTARPLLEALRALYHEDILMTRFMTAALTPPKRRWQPDHHWEVRQRMQALAKLP